MNRTSLIVLVMLVASRALAQSPINFTGDSSAARRLPTRYQLAFPGGQPVVVPPTGGVPAYGLATSQQLIQGLLTKAPAFSLGSGLSLANGVLSATVTGSLGAGNYTFVTPYTRAAIQAAVDALPATGGIVRLEPNKTYGYTTADRVSVVGKNNVIITCPGSCTLDGGTLENELIFTNNTDGLLVENVYLKSVCTDFGYGLFFANESAPVTNLTLRNVGLDAPTININGLAIIAWSQAANNNAGAGTFHRNIHLDGCYTLPGRGLGRMFYEFQSTNFSEGTSGPYRITDVLVEHCDVNDTGLIDNANGMAFSNSGRLKNVRIITNKVKNFRGNAIEYVCTEDGIVEANVISSTVAGTNGIVATDGGNGAGFGAHGLSVGVNSINVAQGAINTYYANNIAFTGGSYTGTRLYLQNSSRLTLNGLKYTCTGGNETLYLDNTSDCQITGGTYTSLETGTTYQKVGFTNGAVRNTVVGVRMAGKASANGQEITQSNTGNLWSGNYYQNTDTNVLTKIADQTN